METPADLSHQFRTCYLPAAGAPDADLAAHYELRVAHEKIHLIVDHGQVLVAKTCESTLPHVILEFRDASVLHDLLRGDRHPMLAFLHGDLRSHGHLILSMRFFGLFDSERIE